MEEQFNVIIPVAYKDFQFLKKNDPICGRKYKTSKDFCDIGYAAQ